MSDGTTTETDATSYSDGVEMLTAQSDPFALYQKLCEATALIELLERERDEARKSLEHITEYGTEEINAAIEMRQKAATALLENAEAQKDLAELCARYNKLLGVKEPKWYNGREIPANIEEAAK